MHKQKMRTMIVGDFSGPFQKNASMLRSSILRKSYVAIFICFTTMTLQFEQCSDLTTAAFIAVFVRFVGRRRLPFSKATMKSLSELK